VLTNLKQDASLAISTYFSDVGSKTKRFLRELVDDIHIILDIICIPLWFTL